MGNVSIINQLLESVANIKSIKVTPEDKARNSDSFLGKLQSAIPEYTLTKSINKKTDSDTLMSSGGFIINTLKIPEGSYTRYKQDSAILQLVIPEKKFDFNNQEKIIETTYDIKKEGKVILQTFSNLRDILKFSGGLDKVGAGYQKALAKLTTINRLPTSAPVNVKKPATAKLADIVKDLDPELAEFANYMTVENGVQIYRFKKFCDSVDVSKRAVMTFKVFFKFHELSDYIRSHYTFGDDYVIWTGKLGNPQQMMTRKGAKDTFIRSERDDDWSLRENSIVAIKKIVLDAACDKLGLHIMYKPSSDGHKVTMITDMPEIAGPSRAEHQPSLMDGKYDKKPREDGKSYEDPDSTGVIPGDIATSHGKLLFKRDIVDTAAKTADAEEKLRVQNSNAAENTYEVIVKAIRAINPYLVAKSGADLADFIISHRSSRDVTEVDLAHYFKLDGVDRRVLGKVKINAERIAKFFWSYLQYCSILDKSGFYGSNVDIDTSKWTGDKDKDELKSLVLEVAEKLKVFKSSSDDQSLRPKFTSMLRMLSPHTTRAKFIPAEKASTTPAFPGNDVFTSTYHSLLDVFMSIHKNAKSLESLAELVATHHKSRKVTDSDLTNAYNIDHLDHSELKKLSGDLEDLVRLFWSYVDYCTALDMNTKVSADMKSNTGNIGKDTLKKFVLEVESLVDNSELKSKLVSTIRVLSPASK